MRIAEIYRSIQGEGELTGTASIFVRASGCNLRCSFCDTPFASWSPEGEDLGVGEILQQVARLGCDHVVLTGGEPMLFAELLPLCQGLREAGRHITIETAGTLYLPVECDLMSISPKLSNSTPAEADAPRWRSRHEQTRIALDVVTRLMAEFPHQLKFVVGTPDDCREVEAFLSDVPTAAADNVWLMPLGIEADRLTEIGHWLEPYCLQRGYRFCPRKHIEWFGLARGT